MGKLISTTTAAKIMGSKDGSNIRKAIEAGRLPAIKPGHDWLIDEDDFMTWLKSKRTWKNMNIVNKEDNA